DCQPSDVMAVLESINGPDEVDSCVAPVTLRKYSTEEIRRVRIGYFEDDGRTPVTAATRAVVRSAALRLEQAGFNVCRFRPEGLERARELWWKFFGLGGAMLLGPMTTGHESELSPILKEFAGWTAAETPHTAQTLLDTWIQRDVLRTQVFRQMKEI